METTVYNISKLPVKWEESFVIGQSVLKFQFIMSNKTLKKSVLLVLFTFLFNACYSQINYQDQFKKKGYQIATKENVSSEVAEKILAFDFEPYRKEHAPLVIKIIEGPAIALFSKDQLKGVEIKMIDIGHNHGHSHEKDKEDEETPILTGIPVITLDIL